jgi:GxxExxY protein
MELNSKSKPEIAEGAENPASTGVYRLAENEFTDKIIGAAIEVHRHLGPGLLESAYEACLCYELSQMGLRFERQVNLPIRYKGIQLASAHRLDLLVEDAVIVEIKATEPNEALHCAQLLTYLKSSGKRVGLLINFNVPVLKKGIKRVVNHFREPGPTRDASAPSAAEPRERRIPEFPDETSSLISQRLPQRLRASASNTEPSSNKEPM